MSKPSDVSFHVFLPLQTTVNILHKAYTAVETQKLNDHTIYL